MVREAGCVIQPRLVVGLLRVDSGDDLVGRTHIAHIVLKTADQLRHAQRCLKHQLHDPALGVRTLFRLQKINSLEEVYLLLLEQLGYIHELPGALDTSKRNHIGVRKHVVERIRTGVAHPLDDELALNQHLRDLSKVEGSISVSSILS